MWCVVIEFLHGRSGVVFEEYKGGRSESADGSRSSVAVFFLVKNHCEGREHNVGIL